jgi:hypothetical protein
MSLRHARGEGRGPDGNPLLLPYEVHGVRVMSLGFVVEPDKAAIWRGPMVHGAIQQLLGDVVWGELDYLVVDLPPGTGDVHLSLAQSVPLTGAVVVCTPQPVALADARKAVDLFRSTKTDVLGLVENMSFHACPSCGHHDDVFGGGESDELAARGARRTHLDGARGRMGGIRRQGTTDDCPYRVALPQRGVRAFRAQQRRAVGRLAGQYGPERRRGVLPPPLPLEVERARQDLLRPDRRRQPKDH